MMLSQKWHVLIHAVQLIIFKAIKLEMHESAHKNQWVVTKIPLDPLILILLSTTSNVKDVGSENWLPQTGMSST